MTWKYDISETYGSRPLQLCLSRSDPQSAGVKKNSSNHISIKRREQPGDLSQKEFFLMFFLEFHLNRIYSTSIENIWE
jgi:hypothetical protein